MNKTEIDALAESLTTEDVARIFKELSPLHKAVVVRVIREARLEARADERQQIVNLAVAIGVGQG